MGLGVRRKLAELGVISLFSSEFAILEAEVAAHEDDDAGDESEGGEGSNDTDDDDSSLGGGGRWYGGVEVGRCAGRGDGPVGECEADDGALRQFNRRWREDSHDWVGDGKESNLVRRAPRAHKDQVERVPVRRHVVVVLERATGQCI